MDPIYTRSVLFPSELQRLVELSVAAQRTVLWLQLKNGDSDEEDKEVTEMVTFTGDDNVDEMDGEVVVATDDKESEEVPRW